MIKKEPHRRICTRFSGHRFKIEKWVSIMDASLNAEGASILIGLKRVGSCMFCACGDRKERRGI